MYSFDSFQRFIAKKGTCYFAEHTKSMPDSPAKETLISLSRTLDDNTADIDFIRFLAVTPP